MVNPLQEALRRCTTCGLCLPECPTFLASGLEPESPRGRVQALALGVTEVPDADTFASFWSCLSCGACLDVCPTGVDVVAAYRDARRDRPDGTPRRLRAFLAQQLSDGDPAVRAVGAAALRRAERRPPQPAPPVDGAHDVLVAGDLVPEATIRAAHALARGWGRELRPDLNEHLAGATGFLLDAGLTATHEQHVELFATTCRDLAPGVRLVALDADAWRLADLAVAHGREMVTFPEALAEGGWKPAPPSGTDLVDHALGAPRWAEPLGLHHGGKVATPPSELRHLNGPLVMEAGSVDVLAQLVARLREASAGRTLLTADQRTLARIGSARFYLDLLAGPSPADPAPPC